MKWPPGTLAILLGLGALGVAVRAWPARSVKVPLSPWVSRIEDGVVVVRAEGVLACAKEHVVATPQDIGGGRIERILEEGATVAKGDVIVKLSTDNLESEEREARLELTRRRAELARQVSDDSVAKVDLESKIRTHQEDLALNKQLLSIARAGADTRTLESLELRIEKARVENAGLKRRLRDQEALRGRGFLSDLDYAAVAIDAAKAQVDQLKQENLLALQRDGQRPQELGRIDAVVTKFGLSLDLARSDMESQVRQQRLNHARKEAEIADKKATVAERLRLRGLTSLKAPDAGTVLYSDSFWGTDELGPGVQVYSGQVLVKVVQRGQMNAKLHIAERWAEKVKVGQRAEVRPTGSARWLAGKVQKVSNVAEQLTNDPKAPRLVPVVVSLDVDQPELRPNTHCTARIEVAHHPRTSRVPIDLVRDRKGTDVTFEVWSRGVAGPGGLSRRTVPSVDQDGDHVFVTGLEAGTALVFEGDGG